MDDHFKIVQAVFLFNERTGLAINRSVLQTILHQAI